MSPRSRKLLKLVETLQLELARDGDHSEDRRYHAGAFLSGELRKRSGRNARGGTTTTTTGENTFFSDKRPGNPRTTRDSAMICDDGGGGGDSYPCLGATDREDLMRLRLENRNMHLLLVENRELKTQIREEAANAELVQRELRDKLGRVQGKLDEVTGELEAARGRLLLLPQPAVATAAEEATISRWAVHRSIGCWRFTRSAEGGLIPWHKHQSSTITPLLRFGCIVSSCSEGGTSGQKINGLSHNRNSHNPIPSHLSPFSFADVCCCCSVTQRAISRAPAAKAGAEGAIATTPSQPRSCLRLRQ